jgi:VWFA-related protein
VREVLRKDGIVHNPWVQANAALFALLLAAFPYYLSAGAQPDFSHGLVRLDVVVSDKSGSPITGLKPEDFTLFDNGQPLKLVSFRARTDKPKSLDNPVELILVIDALNLSSQQVAVAEREAETFLRENHGQLAHPTMVYRLTGSGLSASQQPSTEGTALVQEVLGKSKMRTVWQEPSRVIEPQLTTDYSNDRNRSSLKALGAIAIEAMQRPGRKLLLWISPGWPAETGDSSFEEIVEFSTRLREARMSLYSVTAWPYPKREITYEEFLKPVRIPKDALPGDMALEVLATKSGGRVMPPAPNLDELIGQCAEHTDQYYTLTFDPPRATGPDEYHSLRVTVDKPEASIRTNNEYYDQPSFYDEPATPREQVSVKRLQEVLESLRSQPGSDAVRRISDLSLTERLSRTALEKLESFGHEPKAKEALIALSDSSAFLPPPSAEILSEATPSLHDQQEMFERTVNYLHDAIPTMPNLFARRTTVQFEESAQSDTQAWKVAAPDQMLHPSEPESVTVLIRHWKEVTEKTKLPKRTNRGTQGLTTEGTFGPILAIVAVVDILGSHSQVTWSRWEQSPEGMRAVFRYSVPGASSHLETRFCCLAEADGTGPYAPMSAYHGEITIDPKTGAIFRVTAQADFPPRSPMLRSDLMVEYGPIVIGGQTYICPARSVAISRSRTVKLLHVWNMDFGVYGPFETAINDVTFSDYHLFRSEIRILTDAPPTP